MKNLLPIIAAAGLIVYGNAALAGELPTYEVTGFPITRLQVAVLGSSGVEEQSPGATLTFAGMPASPHQVTVLTPRLKVAQGAAPTDSSTVGFSAK
ncbi:hypothetical protein [Bradyrhizobium sp. Gha]|uniref:hypothetical protein n=1 Tax=Bradyrhizobium sp. Gha TaxID=1855318 RepID=UPI0008EC1128|nr:hypothetical protein [Bradyrhizobium sp. Gha]SFI42439.1 hypothetical protein SAMN05216525_108170 [Bradyrhizobium sp. Gha]